VILKIVPENGFVVYTGENRPITEKHRRKLTNVREEQLNRNSAVVSGTILEARRNFQFNFLFKKAP
jgi:hypothetical protein